MVEGYTVAGAGFVPVVLGSWSPIAMELENVPEADAELAPRALNPTVDTVVMPTNMRPVMLSRSPARPRPADQNSLRMSQHLPLLGCCPNARPWMVVYHPEPNLAIICRDRRPSVFGR